MVVIEGVATNGITYLAKHLVKKFSNKYALPYKMRTELSRSSEKETEHHLLSSLQIAIGGNGTLTEVANRTLVDIANSNLLDYLISVFGSKVEPDNAKELIVYIHRSRGSNSIEESIEFAQVLSTCLTVASEKFQEKHSEHSLVTDNKRQIKIAEERGKRADAAIFSIINQLKNRQGEWISGKDFSSDYISNRINDQLDPLLNYASTLSNNLNNVDVHGALGDVLQVPLDKIYVDVPVSSISRDQNFNKYRDLRTHLHRSEVSDNWADTLEQIDKVVLLGDPGGGKSTLSKKMCLESAREFPKTQARLPFYIQLRTYISKAKDDENFSLAHYILEAVNATHLDDDDVNLNATILYLLRIGSAFVVFDGLDEVLTSSNRARVVSEITEFSKKFPLAAILVTSRYVGYEAQPLIGFRHFGVDLLNESAIDQIYRNVSETVLNRSKKEVDRRLPAFKEDCSSKAAELIRSPLLLTLIVIIYNKKSEIPDNRASLYSFCAELLFDRWDSYRDIAPELPERYRLFDLFKHLSSMLYEKEDLGGRINKTTLEKVARDFFREDYTDNKEGRSAKAAKHMVDHLTGRAWILHEVGENLFEFTHRTFLEFFYAKFLEAEFETTNDIISKSIEHIRDGRRTLPTHLALQIRTKDKRATSSRVAERLKVELQTGARNEELINFCVETLEYIVPNATALIDFVATLAPLALNSRRSEVSMNLLCSQNPMRSVILEEAEKSLKNLRRVQDVIALAYALYQLKSIEEKKCFNNDTDSNNLISNYLNLLYKKQITSPYITKISFDLDAKINWSAVQGFGLRLWINNHARGWLSRLITRDARYMLLAAGENLVNADYEKDKYFNLVESIHHTSLTQGNKYNLDPYYLHNLSANLDEIETSIKIDDGSWRDNKEAHEIYAFALAFFFESNIYTLSKLETTQAKRVYINLVDALEGYESNAAEWHKNWAKGTNSLITNRSRSIHRGKFFQRL